jgi:UDP-2,3-diacylglucosamine hydrolase
MVLSDWDAAAHPPRAQLLCLSPAGAQRVDLR